MNDRSAFLYYLAVLWALIFVAVALITPPDPYTQLLSAGPPFLLAVPLAWWLAYRNGAEQMRERVR